MSGELGTARRPCVLLQTDVGAARKNGDRAQAGPKDCLWSSYCPEGGTFM